MRDDDGRHLRLADLKGKRFGKLTVIEYNNDGTWLCRCDCGNYTNKKTGNLQRNKNPNCGCIHNGGNYKHNLSHSRLYNIWMKMRERCYKDYCSAYPLYGGRGIKMCDEWVGKDGFINFHTWAINNGYSDTLSIDRIDVDGNYSPENCRWVNMEIQQNNRTNNHRLTFNGENHTISEWAKIYNMPYDRLQARIANGWSIEKALLTPKMSNQFTEFKGEN